MFNFSHLHTAAAIRNLLSYSLKENRAAVEEAFKELITREHELRHVYTCCKACLYCRHRTGAFTVTVSYQWGGEVHQAIIHPGTKQFRVRASVFYNSLLRTKTS